MTTVNVGVIGYGTIGTGVVRILQKDAALLEKRAGRPIVLKTVAELHPTPREGIDASRFALTDDALSVCRDPDIHIVVEVIGGVQPARQFIEEALRNGKHVITANKELMAKHGRELLALAHEHNVNLGFEASVGGGIPIIHALTSSLAGNRFARIYGILNGTTNYILTRMHNDGVDFGAVLKEAQDLGYAEADPSSDVDGHDIAYKLCLLAAIAFDTFFDINEIFREGIRSITARDIAVAKEFGYVIKILAVGVQRGDNDVELRVHPVMIPTRHPLASVNDAFNAVFVEGENVGESMFYGRGAGELPTASAIMGDMVEIVRTLALQRSGMASRFGGSAHRMRPMGDIESRYYLRLKVADAPGVLGAIAQAFGQHEVSIRSVKQQEGDGTAAELIIMTHAVREARMQAALTDIRALPTVDEVCSLIRVGL
ncbi:MAG: homoserine dehydrogenase [Proteobacteria bacterium]|nr:homoserine dehydrogenase [Pseudomonadota bacterium]